MEKFEVIDARAVGMIEGGAVKDLILLPDNVFNLLWEHLQKQREAAQAAKVGGLIEKSTVKDLLELPEAIFNRLHERLGHVRTHAQHDRGLEKQEQLKQQRQAIPRRIKL
jgi:hypothetical protein